MQTEIIAGQHSALVHNRPVLVSTQAAQLTKADFLAELRGKAASLLSAAPAVKGGVRSVSVAVPVGVSASEQAAAPEGPAWDALRDDDFAALSSGLKMKDWVSLCTLARTDARSIC